MERVIDLTGQRFGRWTVLYRTQNNNTYQAMWFCRCDCGTERIVNGQSLRRGLSTNCGCKRKQTCIEDLTGRRFGKLTVLELTTFRSHKHCVWKCKCDCGTICNIASNSLLSGKRISCGCIKSKTEKYIKDFFDKHNIVYQQQKRFIGCKNIRSLPFDFYLPEYNLAIEYDGELHYMDVKLFHEKTKTIKIRDKIKTDYCEENDILLLRIPYWEKENIESILIEWLNIDYDEEANSLIVDLSA